MTADQAKTASFEALWKWAALCAEAQHQWREAEAEMLLQTPFTEKFPISYLCERPVRSSAAQAPTLA